VISFKEFYISEASPYPAGYFPRREDSPYEDMKLIRQVMNMSPEKRHAIRMDIKRGHSLEDIARNHMVSIEIVHTIDRR
jgi:hypothetical protein